MSKLWYCEYLITTPAMSIPGQSSLNYITKGLPQIQEKNNKALRKCFKKIYRKCTRHKAKWFGIVYSGNFIEKCSIKVHIINTGILSFHLMILCHCLGLDLSRDKTFVQRYVDNPLLIDDRKFDIGVYTIITSIDPLRIYTVDHEFLLR